MQVTYSQWMTKYASQINDIFQIFLDGVNFEEKYYSDHFYFLFTRILYNRSSKFISKFI